MTLEKVGQQAVVQVARGHLPVPAIGGDCLTQRQAPDTIEFARVIAEQCVLLLCCQDVLSVQLLSFRFRCRQYQKSQ
ncbi:MAG: hypothetical protein AAGK00_15700 [Pseudomonadota bacterium]